MVDYGEHNEVARTAMLAYIIFLAIGVVIVIMLLICCWRKWLCFKRPMRHGTVLSMPPQQIGQVGGPTGQGYMPVPTSAQPATQWR